MLFVGYDVWIDFNNPNLIELNDGVHIANRCLLLCHKRNIDNYFEGDVYGTLPYKMGKITIGKGVLLGMGTYVMPGVTIGEGSLIAPGSIVTKDIPAWVVAAGRPAKVIRSIAKRS